jgi:hypothetical protein
MELASGHFRVEDVGFAVQEGSVDVAGLVQEIVLQAANRRIYFADAQVHRPGIEREVRWRSGIPGPVGIEITLAEKVCLATRSEKQVRTQEIPNLQAETVGGAADSRVPLTERAQRNRISRED